ncbi:MAG TPA: PIG-L family deacetylase [Bryobacteraceae bacterium]|jgi:LmbE family N-acetylglucosaminyl deacetylase
MRIACIHAHPDDAEILAGGTLALLSQLGHEISIVTMSPGDCGSAVHDAEQIAGIRRSEATAAAKFIGAEYRCAEFRDLAIFSDNASRRKVTGLLRDLRSDVILTASPRDYLSDHEATSELVRDACFAASVPNYVTPGHGPLQGIPWLYFVDPIEGTDRDGNVVVPDFTVNVASTIDRKRVMLAKHESQRSWLRQQHGVDDYLDQMERWTRACGNRSGVTFGEGFRHYTGHPYPREPVLQRILAEFIV